MSMAGPPVDVEGSELCLGCGHLSNDLLTFKAEGLSQHQASKLLMMPAGLPEEKMTCSASIPVGHA